MIKAARKVSATTISRRLADAGLAWLRRRRKTLVPAAHKVARIDFNTWVLRCHDTTLKMWVYSDGTTWFLAKGWDEFEAGQQRAALGPHVWRMGDGSDGLFEPPATGDSGRVPITIENSLDRTVTVGVQLRASPAIFRMTDGLLLSAIYSA